MSEDHLNSLLAVWQEQHSQGQEVPAAELCRDCPELVEELNRRIQVLRRMNALMQLDAPSSNPEEPGSATGSHTAQRQSNFGSADTRSTLGGHSAATTTPARLPDSVPGYEILGELGRGGMGVVYKAQQTKLKRLVALKMILAGSHSSQEAMERFLNEAKTVALLRHPNIVQVYEFGSHESRPFFSLEYLEGGSLAEKLHGEPQPPTDAARLIETLARAVQAAHEQGIIHRDLKPANVLLAGDGTPKVTDFGLAKQSDSAMTATGAVMGTPSYMAPEQAAGNTREVGPAADIYSLGTILYETLTGRPPFKGASAWDTVQMVVGSEPVAPRQLNPQAPRDLETICLKCLRKDPRQRYASALELADDLRRFLEDRPIQARPTGRVERLRRWRRRNPVLASSLLLTLVSLLTATGLSSYYGVRAEQARRSEAARAVAETQAKQEAEHAHRDAQRQLIDLRGASGLTAAHNGDYSLALLWFTQAVQLAKDEPELQELNRIRAGNLLRQVSRPEGTFALAGFRQHQDRFRIFQFSPDGRYLLAVAGTHDCLLWDCQRSQQVRLPESVAKSGAAAWEPKSGLLAVAAKGGAIQLLAPPTFEPVEEVKPGATVSVLAFSADGENLAWGGSEGARVWHRGKKAYTTPMLPHPGPVLTLSFSVSGRFLATSARDHKARVFRINSDTSEPLFPPVPHTRTEHGLAHGGADRVAPRFAADDSVLLTVESMGEHTHRLAWRSAASGKLLTATQAPGGGSLTTAARTILDPAMPLFSIPPSGQNFLTAFTVSPRGDQVAVMWEDNGQLWDTRTRRLLGTLAMGERYNWCEDIAFAPDGKTLVTCGHNLRAQFWSVENRPKGWLTASSSPVLHPMKVVRATLSPDGGHLATALWDGTVYLWGMPEKLSPVYSLPAGGTTLPVVSPDGRFVLPGGTTYRNGTQLRTQVYHAQTGKAAGPVLDPGGIFLNAVFNPDGSRLATASSTGRTIQERSLRLFDPAGKGGNVQLWNWKTGQRLVGPIATPSEPRGLAFHPNGRILAAVCADYRVVLIDPDTGKITHNLDPGVHTRPFNANLWRGNGEARFSLDGRFLVTWEMAAPVHVWNPATGRLLHTLPHDERVESVAFCQAVPDLLATGGRDSVARVWDMTTGNALAQLRHPSQLSRVQFSPDGRELLTSCADGTLRAWDWRAGKLRDALELHPSAISDFGFSVDGRWLLTLGLESLQLTDWRARTPAGPLWSLSKNIHFALAISAENRRVIVGGFSGSLETYDLEAMTTPLSGAAEDLVSLAELAAGRRILNRGSVVPLSSFEWAERWRQQMKRREASKP